MVTDQDGDQPTADGAGRGEHGSRAPARLTPKGIRTRTKILAAARTIFCRDGYTAARVGDIALEAGLSLGAVYRYFEDKDELFAELFENLHHRFLEATRSDHAPMSPQQLRVSIQDANEGYFALYAAERDFMRAVVEASAVSHGYMERWSAMYDEIAGRFMRRISKLEGASWHQPGLANTVFALVCLTEQVAYVNFSRRGPQPTMTAPALAELVTSIWWASLTDGATVGASAHTDDT